MKITLKGETYTISQQAQDMLRAMLVKIVADEYNKMGSAEQLAVMGAARMFLHKEEKKWGKEMARPPKGADPVLFLTDMQLKLGLLMADGLTIELASDEQSNLNVTGIQAPDQGKAGGQLADPGDQGQRENDLRQSAGAQPLASVS